MGRDSRRYGDEVFFGACITVLWHDAGLSWLLYFGLLMVGAAINNFMRTKHGT